MAVWLLELISKLPHSDDEARDVKKGFVYSGQSFISDDQGSEIDQPREGPFYFPSSSVSFHDAILLFVGVFSVFPVRSNQVNSANSQKNPQPIRVIGLVANASLEPNFRASRSFSWNLDGVNCVLGQLHFRRRCRGNGASKRSLARGRAGSLRFGGSNGSSNTHWSSIRYRVCLDIGTPPISYYTNQNQMSGEF